VAAVSSVSAFVALAAVASAPTLAQTPAQPDTRPPCKPVLVAMEDTVDSSRSKSGEVFRFRLVDPAVTPDGTVVPAGTLGYGVVANSAHADRGGRPGYLALETRFFVLDNGRHVAAIIDRANDQASTAVGATANAPSVLGLIPIVGYAVGGYDAMHHGRDATIPRGTRVAVFVGDDAALGTCRPLNPGESPPPRTTPAPAPATTTAAPVVPGSATPPPPPVPQPTPVPATTPAPGTTPTASPTMALYFGRHFCIVDARNDRFPIRRAV
jgi:hypothetical protein